MKTHGKHAEEKRKLKEEEARKKEMEIAQRRKEMETAQRNQELLRNQEERMMVNWATAPQRIAYNYTMPSQARTSKP